MPQIIEQAGPRKYSSRKRVYHLSSDEQKELFDALVLHYSGRESVDDPQMKARQVIKSVCEAKNLDGSTWKNCPEEFDSRLKRFGFDYQTKSTISGFFESKTRKKDPTGAVPRELTTSKSGNAIGSSSLLSSDEEKSAKQIYKQLLKDFPEITIESDREILRMLAKQMIIYDRITMHALANGQLPKNFNLDGNIIQNIERLEKMLGIDRPSREKVRSQTEEGSVADLVVEFEDYVNSGQFAEREKLWMLEEWALLLRKLDREDPDNGTEIDEIVFQRLSGVPSEVARKFIKNPYYKTVNDLKEEAIKTAESLKEKERLENAAMRKRAERANESERRQMRKKLQKEGRSLGEIMKIIPRRKQLRRTNGSQRPTQF